MKLAILGGSFNPVHIGHLCLADAVLASGFYDRIILVPAYQSPFKLDLSPASPGDRLDMLAASIAGDPRLAIDDCEIRREGVSYTIDTLKYIIDWYRPEGKPGLILGDDLAADFHKWRSPGEIAELADIVVARREGIAAFPYPHRILNNEIVKISSSEVRKKIGSSEAWRFLVPAGARYIIEERGLYGLKTKGPEENSSLSPIIIRIENDIRVSLDFHRFTHSRNTALMSWDLCKRFGLDPVKGYLAGIAHDMCKKMESDELIRMARKDGASLSKLELEKPGLLHARAAAVMIERDYGVADRDIIEAIRYHTTGRRDMGPYAKVVYAADKIEVSRQGADPALREMSQTADLDTLFTAVLDDTVAHLKSRHLDISYGTRRLLTAMNKRKKR